VAVERRSLLSRTAAARSAVERLVLRAKRALGLLRDQEARLYLGYGTPDRVQVKGRVREEPGVDAPHPGDSAWENLRDTVRLFTATPVPDVPVLVRLGGTAVPVRSDADGWFRAELRPPQPLTTGWHEVSATLLAPRADGAVAGPGSSLVLVPAADASCAIVSDLDDTVLRSGLTNPLRAVLQVLVSNATTRTPFPGVAAFYRALQAGPSGADENPLFYVSSSPWNLYDVVTTFLDLRQIPRGPLFLRAWGWDADGRPGGGHAGHKTQVVLSLLDTYPHLPFVLIGDSGQEDPEIYRDLVLARPGRVRTVVIRDVTAAQRDASVQAVAQQVRAAGVPFALVPDTAAAARHAASLGLLSADALPDVVAACAEG
jgi:phosphatidate phosphatase APP1